ncbi:protein DEHYDRATION-INDUCED 19 homolog 7-like isoform X2 [Primulina huaijiensis]|uniref:protein DEHYDRATION-INDUCED 19 homolog 7-like isoform X2 n=1 Tax=Primulina huaijiensis TaxID=1492673 RepID=UPI003CC76D0F
MDSDSWIRSSIGYRRYQSRSDAFRGEEYEGEGELRAEFLCPFCAQDFDMVGLCCHIDEEHAIEAKNGVCPLCSKKVASDLVCHMTLQHGSLLRMHRKRRLRRGLSNLSFSSLRKDLLEGKLQSLLGGSSFVVPTSNSEPDPLLNSFICNPTVDDKFPSVQSLSSVEASPVEESMLDTLADGVVPQPPLSEEDQKEKTQKCKFVQGLLLSTFLDDNLS